MAVHWAHILPATRVVPEANALQNLFTLTYFSANHRARGRTCPGRTLSRGHLVSWCGVRIRVQILTFGLMAV